MPNEIDRWFVTHKHVNPCKEIEKSLHTNLQDCLNAKVDREVGSMYDRYASAICTKPSLGMGRLPTELTFGPRPRIPQFDWNLPVPTTTLSEELLKYIKNDAKGESLMTKQDKRYTSRYKVTTKLFDVKELAQDLNRKHPVAFVVSNDKTEGETVVIHHSLCDKLVAIFTADHKESNEKYPLLAGVEYNPQFQNYGILKFLRGQEKEVRAEIKKLVYAAWPDTLPETQYEVRFMRID